jgi:hypothetical protein
MNARKPKYTAEEAGRRGDEIYARVVKPQVEPQHHGRVVAIDIESEEFVLDDSVLAAAETLRQRVPNAEIWCVRVGFPALHHFGGWRLR